MKQYRKHLRNLPIAEIAGMETDQMKSLPDPPIEKPFTEHKSTIDLIPAGAFTVGEMKLIDAIWNRKSRREYSKKPLDLEELSFLLWSTQGVKSLSSSGLSTLRTVPSGGAMHPFETYLIVNNVEGLAPALYRYLAVEHKLLKEREIEAKERERIGEICDGQSYVASGAVVFIWTVRCYRTEWRYGDDSLKDILISVGHICQNLYLACEAIGAGTCAILAYQQEPLETFIGVDGDDEIALYLAPVGKASETP